MTISEMTPGPIAINSATFVGIQVGGFLGAVVATLGCVLPSFIIVLTLAFVYYKFKGLSIVSGVLAGLRPAVISMIASAGISLLVMSWWGDSNFPFEFRTPEIDNLSLKVNENSYEIVRIGYPKYEIRDSLGDSVLELRYSLIARQWSVYTDNHFTAPIICGIILFCQYLEFENDVIVL